MAAVGQQAIAVSVQPAANLAPPRARPTIDAANAGSSNFQRVDPPAPKAKSNANALARAAEAKLRISRLPFADTHEKRMQQLQRLEADLEAARAVWAARRLARREKSNDNDLGNETNTNA